MEVTCPAGEELGRGCLCRIERHLVDAQTEPASLATYCTGNYKVCPTWRDHKEAIWSDGAKSMDRELEREARVAGR